MSGMGSNIYQLKMHQIEKLLVSEIPVVVPISAPPETYAHLTRNTLDVAAEVVEAPSVSPIDVRVLVGVVHGYVDGPGRIGVVVAVGPLQVGAAVVEGFILFHLIAVATEHSAIVVPYYCCEQLL